MVNSPKKNKLQTFLDKHQKLALTYSVIIWTILIIAIMAYNSETSNHISREDMKKEIEEKCSNEIIMPEGEFGIKFDYNPMLNVTTCEVLTK